MAAPPGRLAVLGGPPAFSPELHVGRPNVPDRRSVLEGIGRALDRRRLTNHGPYVEAFERRLAEHLDVRHCVTTSSGTSALELAIRCLGLSGEVVVPAFTFVATAHAVRLAGARPVFCDVDPATHNIDPERLEEVITPSTTAVVGVHLWGRPCPVDRLAEVAGRRGLVLLFDAAQAMGCTWGGRPLGGHGAAEVLSFHATKVMNSFEGGAVATDDDRLAERLRLAANFGFADYDEVAGLGTNAKMSEPSAVMGLASLDSLDRFVAHNMDNHAAYRHGLAGAEGVSLMDFDGPERHHHHYVVTTVGPGAGLTRDELQRALWAEGVLARRYFHPGCHRMEPYRSEDPDAGDRLPVTERLAAEVLCLPTGTAVSRGDVGRVCELVNAALEHAGQVRSALGSR